MGLRFYGSRCFLFVYSDSKFFGCSAPQAKFFWDFLSQSLRFSFNNVTVTELKEILIISSAPQANFFFACGAA